MNTAIVILADPGGGDDAAGRVFNGLAVAREVRTRGDDVSVVFQGAGTRWAPLLADPGHPFHALFAAVRVDVAGVSSACATVFGSRDDAVDAGFDLVTGNDVDGVGSLASVAALVDAGYTVLTF